MNLAPIVIMTYSRLEHLKQTVESLKSNAKAIDSLLYFLIDAPKNGDELKVSAVSQFCSSVTGFKEVIILQRQINNRVLNYREGVEYILKEHGKIIFLEDDNVVSEYFLDFMNNALDFYRDDKNIFSISGYNPPIIYPDKYKYEYVLTNNFNAWGFATWYDRNHLNIENYDDFYRDIKENKKLFKKIYKIHPSLHKGLKLIQDGKLNAGDYRLTAHCIINDRYVVKPKYSLVNNIGHDGSGQHCGITDRLRTDLSLSKNGIIFSEDVKFDPKINKLEFDYFLKKKPFFRRAINKLGRILANYGGKTTTNSAY